MLFNSYGFIFVFLPLCVFSYFFLTHRQLFREAKLCIALGSLIFYAWWNPIYLPLIILSVLTNYHLAQRMIDFDHEIASTLSKKTLLRISLVFNVGLLCYFKYMDFLIENVNLLFGTELALLHLTLPLAISFFTLQQIAYLVDCYEGLVKEKSLLDYSLFVTFFPQLIAGPIVHHKEMMPQFAEERDLEKNDRNIALGIFIFSIGLFKKVMIADHFAVWATAGFDGTADLSFFSAWFTSLSYTFQLYFDFSGYTDMAIGAAYFFNIQLPQNFNSPYKATGMIDFWKRWHITLTHFITTYIYTPIVRSFNKLNLHKAMFATVVTFLIAGLWHGASWMFVIFGVLNGIGIALNHYWQKKWRKTLKLKIHPIIAWFITFNFVNLTFVFFRSHNWQMAKRVLSGMTELSDLRLNLDKTQALFLVSGFIVTLYFSNTKERSDQFVPTKLNLLFTSLLLAISVLYLNKVSEFLYFNF